MCGCDLTFALKVYLNAAIAPTGLRFARVGQRFGISHGGEGGRGGDGAARPPSGEYTHNRDLPTGQGGSGQPRQRSSGKLCGPRNWGGGSGIAKQRYR